MYAASDTPQGGRIGFTKKHNFISAKIRMVSYGTHVNDIVDLALRVQSTRAEVVGSIPVLAKNRRVEKVMDLTKIGKKSETLIFFKC